MNLQKKEWFTSMNNLINLSRDLFSERGHDKINFDFIKHKNVFGLCGYSKSGKDTTAFIFRDKFHFKRLSFGDTLKDFMNLHCKKLVFLDLKEKYINISLEEIDFHVNQGKIKETLRPYMIYVAEKMKQECGSQYWVNKTLENIGNEKNLIISDIRRVNELELFRNSNAFLRERQLEFKKLGLNDNLNFIPKEFETFLIWVNQLGLRDADELTQQTILRANEDWIINDVIYLDPSIPDIGSKRKKNLEKQVTRIIKKYGF